MKRHAELSLKNWYESHNRKPLVLRGARQVGKSTLVRNFAKSQNLDLIEINFEKHSLKTVEKSLDLSVILPEIEYVTKKKLGPNCLIFLDEIQDSPRMITALRFFKEERPDLAVVAAGSLLEFALTIHEISIPVGRIQYHHLGPFTFTEFLEALGEHQLLEIIFQKNSNIPDYAHTALQDLYHKYLFVGGMPEAIKTFIETNGNINEVRNVQESIIQSFRDDFHKYSTRAELPRIRKVFDSITRIAGHKVKYTEIDPDEKSRDLKRAIDLLLYARVFFPVKHSNGTSTPLKAYEDISVYKLFFLDVGLLAWLYKIDWNEINANKVVLGILAEQYAAQHLNMVNGPLVHPELHYWLNDKKNQSAEIDFLIELDSKIFPVEVKAGPTGQLKSLLVFLSKHKTIKTAIHIGDHPFSFSPVNYKIAQGDISKTVKGEIIKVPPYLITNLKKIISVKRD